MQLKTTLKELALSRELKDKTVNLPAKPTRETDEYGRVIWSEKYKRAGEKQRKLEELKSMDLALVLG